MEKFKVYLYSGIAIIVIVVVIYFWGKKVGEKVNADALPKDTPWGAVLTDEESKRVVNITEALYNDMKGVNVYPFSQHENKPYEDLSGLSDTLLVAVSNYFYQKYKDTLVNWMKGEYFSSSSIELNGVTTVVIDRLEKLTSKVK